MCYYVQRVSDHTEHRLAPISEASVLLQEYRCLFSMHFRRPMPIIEQKYQDCCAICLKIPLESARYYAIIIKKERISIKYKRNFRLFSRTTRQRPCWHGNLTTAGRDNRAKRITRVLTRSDNILSPNKTGEQEASYASYISWSNT